MYLRIRFPVLPALAGAALLALACTESLEPGAARSELPKSPPPWGAASPWTR